MFNMIMFRVSDISSYRDLICNQFIPVVNKTIVLARQDVRASRYKEFLNEKEIAFEETLHDVIRLAYVGLFHKLEAFMEDLLKVPEYLFFDLLNKDVSVDKWVNDKYGFKFKDWRRFYITNRVNWICNCVKHYDGFPLKVPKPAGFEFHSENKRLVLTRENFRKDCDELLKFYPLFIQTVIVLCMTKMIFDTFQSSNGLGVMIPDEQAHLGKMDNLARKFMQSLESLDKNNYSH